MRIETLNAPPRCDPQVEPFQRGLKELETDCMINGRRRDHGAERAFLEVPT